MKYSKKTFDALVDCLSRQYKKALVCQQYESNQDLPEVMAKLKARQELLEKIADDLGLRFFVLTDVNSNDEIEYKFVELADDKTYKELIDDADKGYLG